MSLASSQKKVATVAIVDLWNGGATTRYPIGCVSAILSPRTDEQVIALLSERGMQVFSVTHRVRRRHVVIKSSSVRLWKWIGDDVIVIVTKEEVLRWDVRGTAMPKKLFTRNRPYSPSPTDGASRACDYQCTADGRWGLLFVADKERLCDGCRHEPHATSQDCCACETSLLLDLHDFSGKANTRCFRALGASLLDIPHGPVADATPPATSAGAPNHSEGFAWDMPLLAAVIPDADTGLNLLQLLRLGNRQGGGGGDGDCLCSAALQEEGQQHTGLRQLRRSLRESKLPAVPYRILPWRPAPGIDLIVVVTLVGAMTVFKIEPEAAALTKISHDGQAFPAGVVEVEEDSLHGDLVVLSAAAGEDRTWVVSRASKAVS
ncbi:unnamed protein product [Ectocarpus sp. 12 AP-2014]